MAPETRLDADKKLLVVTYLFPPSPEVGAQRVARLCRYLPLYGIRPVVLAAARAAAGGDERLVPPGVEVVRTAARPTLLDGYGWLIRRFFPRRLQAAALAPPAAPSSGPSRHGLRQQILLRLLTPDAQKGWRVPALRAARRLRRQIGFDALLSSGPPWTNHEVARQLKREFRLPWIADFRDPWAHAASPAAPAWKQRLDARLEAHCVQQADLVLCNTDALHQDFVARYPRVPPQRFVTLTNGFDGEPGAELAPAAGRPRLCLHLGSLYGKRRIDTFCQATERLLERGQLQPGQIQIALVGEADAVFPLIAAQHAPRALASGLIEFRTVVGKAAAEDLLAQAGLLLLFQGSYRLQVPAKFYEYLATGRPMFAVTEAGALSQILAATGAGLWATPDDPEAIASQFLKALALPAITPAAAAHRWEATYHFRGLAGQLAAHLRGLTG
ncbi:MAG TPA: glycosyltransferase [Terriglobales bacterium]|nr:glycosyltransferase [Terriglobales bacterium]